MPYALDDNQVEVDGVHLECRWIGPAPDVAPTIVMLHEGLGCVALWRDFPDRLAAATGCGVFVYSRQGYGRSDPIGLPQPVSYMHDHAKNVLPRLLSAIGFERGILLGHSDGASIATIYTGSIEDHRVRGLALYAPHFFVEDISVESIDKAKRDYEEDGLKDRLAKYHGSNVDGAFYGWNRPWLDPEFRRWELGDCIAHIRVPMLIVQGADDQYGTAAQISYAETEAYSPVDSVLLADCGHAPQLNQPDRTLKETASFVDRLMVAHAEAAPLTVNL